MGIVPNKTWTDKSESEPMCQFLHILIVSIMIGLEIISEPEYLGQWEHTFTVREHNSLPWKEVNGATSG